MKRTRKRQMEGPTPVKVLTTGEQTTGTPSPTKLRRKSKRAILLMVAITAALWLMLFALLGAAAAAPSLVNVAVSPNQVDRYEVFVVTISTAFPNSSFSMTLSGHGYVLERNGTTNQIGIWETTLSAALDFGTYTVFVSSLQQTAQATLIVGCSARCISEIQQEWGRYNADLISNGIVQILIVLTIVLFVIEGPKTAHYFWKQGETAIKRGQLTIGDRLKSPLAAFQSFVQPGRQSMKKDVNDRIALDLERRALLEELHDATRPKFLEYDPDHVAALEAIFQDLRAAYDRETRVIASPPPLAHKFERKETDMETQREIAATESWLAQENERPSLQQQVEAHNARLDASRHSRRVIAAALFGTIGILAAVMDLLIVLAQMGVYVDWLRPLWRPWFGDDWKILLGATVGVLAAIAMSRSLRRA